jgi:hypothetical protein
MYVHIYAVLCNMVLTHPLKSVVFTEYCNLFGSLEPFEINSDAMKTKRRMYFVCLSIPTVD